MQVRKQGGITNKALTIFLEMVNFIGDLAPHPPVNALDTHYLQHVSPDARHHNICLHS